MNNSSETLYSHMEMECRIKNQWVLKFLNEHKFRSFAPLTLKLN